MECAGDRVDIRVELTASEAARALRRDVGNGLTDTPKHLPPRWLYDDAGCALFEAITQLDEYYPTRREHEILVARAAAIAELAAPEVLVELGSGTSAKTRLLLDACAATGRLRHFVALDVAEDVLTDAAHRIAVEHPRLTVTGIVGDFEHHLAALPAGGTRLVAFLGGTIGNLLPGARGRFLDGLAAQLAPGDCLLVGTDLVKDRQRLVDAYDDAEGVTAAFNRNMLHRLNRDLGADFDVDAFDHVACFDEPSSAIEMRLRSRRAQLVTIPPLELHVPFAAGEELRTEVSAKFTLPQVCRELRAAGFDPLAQWTDVAGDFGLSLARRP